MRRNTAGVRSSDAVLARRRQQVDQADPAWVIQALEPLVSVRRRERMQETLRHRLAHVTVVLDAPYDPHNGSAVARSCEAFGVQHLHVLERPPQRFLLTSAVARGTVKWLDLTCHTEVPSVLAALDPQVCLVEAHPQGELLPHELAEIPRLALVLGNERDGVREELASVCSHRVRIPMRGFVESLNLSVTAAILLHAATAGRPGDLSLELQQRLYARGLWLSLPHAEQILEACAETALLPSENLL